MRFFITGLPRSRTAWLAVVASTANSTCVHEPIRDVQSFEQLRDAWLEAKGDAGISDSGLGMFIERVQKEVDPNILIVERRFCDVLRSFEHYMEGIELDIPATVRYLERLQASLDKAKGPKVRRIAYDKLADIEELGAAMRWLIPGADFSHLEDMMSVNIQVSRGAMLDGLSKSSSTWFLQ